MAAFIFYLLVAGVLAIGVLCFAGYGIFRETTRERQVRNIVNVADESDVDEKWRLGYMKGIDGSPYLMIPLHSDQSYAQSYYSKSSYSTRNYLFINRRRDRLKVLIWTEGGFVLYYKRGLPPYSGHQDKLIMQLI